MLICSPHSQALHPVLHLPYIYGMYFPSFTHHFLLINQKQKNKKQKPPNKKKKKNRPVNKMALVLCFFMLFSVIASSAFACDRCVHQSKAAYFSKASSLSCKNNNQCKKKKKTAHFFFPYSF